MNLRSIGLGCVRGEARCSQWHMLECWLHSFERYLASLLISVQFDLVSSFERIAPLLRGSTPFRNRRHRWTFASCHIHAWFARRQSQSAQNDGVNTKAVTGLTK